MILNWLFFSIFYYQPNIYRKVKLNIIEKKVEFLQKKRDFIEKIEFNIG